MLLGVNIAPRIFRLRLFVHEMFHVKHFGDRDVVTCLIMSSPNSTLETWF